MRFRRGIETEKGMGGKGPNGGAVQIHPPTHYRNAAAAAWNSAVAP